MEQGALAVCYIVLTMPKNELWSGCSFTILEIARLVENVGIWNSTPNSINIPSHGVVYIEVVV